MFHKNWIEYQKQYKNFLKLPNDRNQAFIGIKAILIVVIIFVQELWTLRNDHVHNPVPHGVLTFKQKQLLEDLKYLFTKKATLQNNDQQILPQIYLNNAATKQNKSIELFIRRNKEIINQSHEEIRNKITQEVPVPPPPPEPDP